MDKVTERQIRDIVKDEIAKSMPDLGKKVEAEIVKKVRVKSGSRL